MEFTWHPITVEAIEYLLEYDGDSPPPASMPVFLLGMLASLYMLTSIPVVAVDETIDNPRWPTGRRTIAEVECMALWAVDIVRNPRQDLAASGLQDDVVEFLCREPVSTWLFSVYSWACLVLADELNESFPGVAQEDFPGCSMPALVALPENLIASLGLVALNEYIRAWAAGDYGGSASLLAAAAEVERNALTPMNQRVGLQVAWSLHRQDLRRRGRNGGAAANVLANGLKAWVDEQANPARRSDRPFARSLAKAAPQELVAGLADPERVIYDHLRRSLLAASS